MKTKLLYLIVFVFALPVIGSSQTAHNYLRKGDKYYETSDYASAELSYRKASEKEADLKSEYNLANSLYQQQRFEEAVDQYQYAVQKTEPGEESSTAYYNLGNAYFNNQDLEQAIKAFKKSVVEDPSNLEAQYNLAVCKEILKQQQQQQHEKQCNNPQPSDDPNQEKKESEDQEQQENQDPQEQDEQQESEEQEDQEAKQDSSQNINEGEGSFDSTRLEKQTLDSLDAAKLLQVIESEEQKVQEKMKKFSSTRKKQDKDW